MYQKISRILFRDEELAHDVYMRLLHRLTQIYVIAILLIFPFYCTNRYFRILRDRRNFFTVATGIYIVCMLLGIIFVLPKEDRAALKNRCILKRSDLLLLMFEGCAVIGLFVSGNFQSVFWGTEGRYQGVFMWLLYGAAYFLISRFWHINRAPIFLFLFGGALSSAWGITDFLGMDIFGWLSLVKVEQQRMFSSSYGNINTYTAALLLVAGVAAGMVIYLGEGSEKSKADYSRSSIAHQKLYFSIVFFVSVIALIFGRSDNAALGMAALLFILPGWAWKSAGGLKAYCILIECIMMAFTCSGYTLSALPELAVNVHDSILLNVSQYYMYYSVPVMILCTAIIWKGDKIDIPPYRRLRLGIYVFYILAGVFGIGIFFLMVKSLFGNDMSSVPIIGRYLHFTDSWGAHRGYIWRVAAEEYLHLGWVKKMFGVGLEMFGNLMRLTRYSEMLQITGEFFDSPHNEFLQYLITSGCVGCLSLFGWILACCKKAMKKESNGIGKACAVAVFSYFVASFVNISVPITQAMAIIIIGMMMAEERE